MDVRIYMMDGQMIEVGNVENIKVVPVYETSSDAKVNIMVYDNSENKHPIAGFYGAVGYQLVNRR